MKTKNLSSFVSQPMDASYHAHDVAPFSSVLSTSDSFDYHPATREKGKPRGKVLPSLNPGLDLGKHYSETIDKK